MSERGLPRDGRASGEALLTCGEVLAVRRYRCGGGGGAAGAAGTQTHCHG